MVYSLGGRLAWVTGKHGVYAGAEQYTREGSNL